MVRLTRLPLLLALFFALSLRALVPVGWMPAQGEGAFAIAPCPASDGASMAMVGHSMAAHHDAAHKDHGGSDCSFSPYHSGFAAAAEVRLVPAPSPGTVIPRAFFAAPVSSTGPPALPPPATGPPSLT
ncbi:MAG TPA: hypothetical protein VGU01_09670 [Sphingomicrobium sp.]|nr:hypothetical protein [Sphingomicrobium sp.]